VGSIVEEMQRIRDHALRRNSADGVYVALLYQSGWFAEWMEGPAAGVRAVMTRVARDSRHRNIRLLHHSHGARSLTEPWSMAVRQVHEKPSDFARRVMELREDRRQHPTRDPASVWRQLSMPLTGLAAARTPANAPIQRVMVCSARGNGSFDLVHWLGQAYQRQVMKQRFGGARVDTYDVATNYVDLDAGAVVRRVIAMARNGLRIGLTQAFLQDYSHVMLLLSGETDRDTHLMNLLVSACARLVRRPMAVGIGRPPCAHEVLRRQAHAGGLVYLDCDLEDGPGPEALWSAVEPALDLSTAAD
jgi:hypothetical protein